MLIEQDGFAQVGRHRFLKTPRNNFWEDAEEDLWDSWIWQQSNRVKTLNTCEKVLNMTDDEREAFTGSSEQFHVGITPITPVLWILKILIVRFVCSQFLSWESLRYTLRTWKTP